MYGIARTDGTVHAQRSIVVPSTNFLYMYGVSAIAGLWVLGRLIQGWTIETTRFTIQRRTEPLSISTGDTTDATEDSDA